MGRFEDQYEKALQAVRRAESGERDVEARGVCQVCLRPLVAKPTRESGGKMVMVKHGYERPGYGYLVGECSGVGHPPFELSCELTKEWRNTLKNTIIPNQKTVVANLESGKTKRFETTYQGPPPLYKSISIYVEEGKPLPPQVTRTIDFEALRKRDLREATATLKAMEDDLVWYDKRIKEWRYAPELLAPKEKAKSEAQTIREWLESPKTREELMKLPSPKGDGKTFLDWVVSFPRTLAWTSMKGHRLPRYYTTIREEYEKATGAPKLVVERPKREHAAISREQAEKEEARAKKLAERTAAKEAKAERSKLRSEKAVRGIEAIKKDIADALANEMAVAELKTRVWSHSGAAGAIQNDFDYFTRMLVQTKAVDFIAGKEDLADFLNRSDRDRWDRKPEDIYRRLREAYEYFRSKVFSVALRAHKAPKA